MGAGAAGLSAAFWLRRAGCHPVVLERSTTIAGRAPTHWVDGYGFDTGAGAIASTGTAVRRLATALGVMEEIILSAVVVGVRTEDGRIHRLARRRPWSLLSFDALDATDKRSLLRLAARLAPLLRVVNDDDLSTAAGLDTITAHEFLATHATPAVDDIVLGAFLRGKLLVEPDRVSVVDLLAAIKSFLVAGHLWTHPHGIAFFLEAAAAGLEVRRNTTVVEVQEYRDRVELVRTTDDGTTLRESFDGCIVGVPAPTMLELLPALDPVRRDYLSTLEYSRALVVGLGVPQAPKEPASVVIRPVSSGADLSAVGLGHHLAPGRVPPGGGILTGFWMSDWSHRHFDDSDEALVEATVDTLASLFLHWSVEPAAWAVGRWPEAMVASRVGTFAGLRAVARVARSDRRVHLAGDFGAQTSVNTSVGAGESAAHRLIEVLRGRPGGGRRR
ncbi:MAG TPA: FAD-dependent oxidoreductase [Candidatus Avipropionibacterium avicola]|uniref:FAD-dependent oxidoreductase n=1 Tax=Candidatus Avipropionibacterium avicola TaxID=2840701 RepID=A0A9D1GWM4_9ACTN|nr:FAD-dependent oxidoreductase [Candidatus Avipropionibacterium avicola]